MRGPLVLILCFLVAYSQSAKILAVFPVPTYSHYILGLRLSKELIKRGHHVTFITPYLQKSPIENLRDVGVVEIRDYFKEIQKGLYDMDDFQPHTSGQLMLQVGCDFVEITLNNTNVRQLMNSNDTFDLVIAEHFMSDAYMGFGYHFKAPVIWATPMTPSIMSHYLVGNPIPSSYIPSIVGPYSKHMNFLQRTCNFLVNQFLGFIRSIHYMPQQRSLFKKYFRTDIDLDDILYNASLMLGNSHFSVSNAIPRVPALIEIAGFHLEEPKKLSRDLQQFMDDAEDGVVVFSMGSSLKSENLKPELRNIFLKSFAKIKQKVLWKFEGGLPESPGNVKIMKWMPQQDVLAHPNVKAFISHGGFMSSVETVYFGVPVIGIPVFGDQKCNIAAAVDNGYAVSLPFSQLSEEKLTWALEEILHNPKYRENAKQRSAVINDQPLKPIETAIFWIEFVIRHRGALHLRSAALDLEWYQREMIDVIAFLAALFLLATVLLGLGIRKVFVMRPKHHKTE